MVVLSGALEETSSPEVDRAAATSLIHALLADGQSPSQAARELARRLRLPRNQAYSLVQDVAGSSGDGE